MAPTSTAAAVAAAVVASSAAADKSALVTQSTTAADAAAVPMAAAPIVGEHKYLHKKFKRIASTCLPPAEPVAKQPPATTGAAAAAAASAVMPNGASGKPEQQHVPNGRAEAAAPLASALLASAVANQPNGLHHHHIAHSQSPRSLPPANPIPTAAATTTKPSANLSNAAAAVAAAADHAKENGGHLNGVTVLDAHTALGQLGMVGNGPPPQLPPLTVAAAAAAASIGLHFGAAAAPQPHNNNDQHHFNQNGGSETLLSAFMQHQQVFQMQRLMQQQQQQQQILQQQQQQQQQQQAAAVPLAVAAKSVAQQMVAQPAASKSPTPGRHVCPYCQLNCAKPSVLQKHIRAHTNERPYPCEPCGFAFKTRSNLYKHCRSRAHALRMQGHEPQPDDETSLGSDPEQDLSSSTSSDMFSRTASPMDDRVSSPLCQPTLSQLSATPQSQSSQSSLTFANNINGGPPQTVGLGDCSKPYKPKFHSASLYAKEEAAVPVQSQPVVVQTQTQLSQPQQPQPTYAKSSPSPLHLSVNVPPASAPTPPTSSALNGLVLNMFAATSSPSAAASSSSSASCGTPTTAGISHPLSTQNVEYLKEHISKIISQNEAIMEVVEPALQKKYHKITGISRGIETNTSSKMALAMLRQREESIAAANAAAAAALAPAAAASSSAASTATAASAATAPAQPAAVNSSSAAAPQPPPHAAAPRRSLPTLQQHAQQVLQSISATAAAANPLNLSNCLPSDGAAAEPASRRQPPPVGSSTPSGPPSSSTSTTGEPTTNTHPQNPERSIIKDLLLNSRGLAVPSGGAGDDAIYTCPLCKINFRSADNLQSHTQYCQGARSSNASPQSAPISPVGSPSHKYFRSNSFHVHLPEKYNPNTLAKLASSTIKHPHRTPLTLAKLAHSKIRPDTVVINTATCPAPVPLAIVVGPALPSTSGQAGAAAAAARQSVSAQCAHITKLIEVDAPLPSPGPLLGKTRLVDSFGSDRADRAFSGQPEPVVEAIVSHFTDTVEGGFRSKLVHAVHAAPQLADPPASKRMRLGQQQQQQQQQQQHEASSCSASAAASSTSNAPAPAPAAPSATAAFNPLNLQQRMSGGDCRILDHTANPLAHTPAAAHSQMSPNALRMCGGDFKIVERRPEVRHSPHFGSSGGSIVSISPSPSDLPPPGMVHLQPALHMREVLLQQHMQQHQQQQQQLQLQQQMMQQQQQQHAAHLLPQPGLLSAKYLPAPAAMQYFQFPSMSSPAITGYNPLTLPLATATATAAAAAAQHTAQIVHGGKLIPFVPGMPGPNNNSAGSAHLLSPKAEPAAAVGRQLPRHSPVAGRRLIPSPLSLQPVAAAAGQSPTAFSVPKQSRQSSGGGGGGGNSAALLQTVPSIRVVMPAAEMPQQQQQPVPPPKNGHLLGANYAAGTNAMWPASAGAAAAATPKPEPRKRFNFTRMADNLSPKKVEAPPPPTASNDGGAAEYRYFNFEKPDTLQLGQPVHFQPPPAAQPGLALQTLQPQPPHKLRHISSPLHIDVSSAPQSQPAAKAAADTAAAPATPTTTRPSRFLRPSSLPLKPGTFTPKRHHGITPTANTLPLISPETPRPSKNCVQLYLNGHAYTYLGLKCSTKTFYCTVNRPQPVHFTNQHKLSIYSNWQVCAESQPHPLNFTPKLAMSLYDSRQRPERRVATASMGPTCTILHSQSLQIVTQVNGAGVGQTAATSSQQLYAANSRLAQRAAAAAAAAANESGGGEGGEGAADGASGGAGGTAAGLTAVPPVPGGYESLEDYTYVRGRGRGKYVCSECGIRCKKPSMLKKHIRTHTDVRPYTCAHCSFSFKTKGNLTKHMKSKAHDKKCKELGVNPLEGLADMEGMDDDAEGESLTSGDHTSTMPGTDSDTDDMMSDGDDSDDNDESRQPEHEAAKSLLFLSQNPPSGTRPGSLIPGRPMTYPYAGNFQALQRDNNMAAVAAAAAAARAAEEAAEKSQQMLMDVAASNSTSHTPAPTPPPSAVASASHYPASSPAAATARRSIAFGGAGAAAAAGLAPFEYASIVIKQEQYYANPKLTISPALMASASPAYRSAATHFKADSASASAASTNGGGSPPASDPAMPMDLTKPRASAAASAAAANSSSSSSSASASAQRFTEVVHVPNGPAGLLSSLVSITDKVPGPHALASPVAQLLPCQPLLTSAIDQQLQQQQLHHQQLHLSSANYQPYQLVAAAGSAQPSGGGGVGKNPLLETYLTERALHDTRIKQSQMYRTASSGGASFACTATSSVLTTTTTAAAAMTLSTAAAAAASGNGLLITAAVQPLSTVASTTFSAFTAAVTSVGSVHSMAAALLLPELHVNTGAASTAASASAAPVAASPFDALKNSPNASKVTYVSKPVASGAGIPATASASPAAPVDSLTWSLKPIATVAAAASEPQPAADRSAGGQQLTITVRESPAEPNAAHVSAAAMSSGMDTLAEIAASSVKLDTGAAPPTPSEQAAQAVAASAPLAAISVKAPAEINAVPGQAGLLVPVSTAMLLVTATTTTTADRVPSTITTTTTTAPGCAAPQPAAQSLATEYLKRSTAEFRRAQRSQSERTASTDTLASIPSTTDDSESDGELIAAAAVAAASKKPPAPAPAASSEATATESAASKQPDESAATATTATATATATTNSSSSSSSSSSSTSSSSSSSRSSFIQEDGRSVCTICAKSFPRKHQMTLHMNIHYMERKFRCEPCAVAFRTHGMLQKHEHSDDHKNKVRMAAAFGVPTVVNPRPFECCDCKVAFRIHGHLAKHLRSKSHVQKLECLQKLPFGTYAEMERAAISLTEIDTTDCENSLASLRVLAERLFERQGGSGSGGKWPAEEAMVVDAGADGQAPPPAATDGGENCASDRAESATPTTLGLKRKASVSESEDTSDASAAAATATATATTTSGLVQPQLALDAEKRPRLEIAVGGGGQSA